MTTARMIRRRNQLRLLEAVCSQSQQAELRFRTEANRNEPISTIMRAVGPDGVWVELPEEPANTCEGTPVEVVFGYEGQQYIFSANTCGRDDQPPAPAGRGPALKLTLPACVECHDRRTEFRIDLSDSEAIEARFVEMGGECLLDSVRITNLSTGGLGGEMDAARAYQIDPRAMYWAVFQLEGEARTIDFAVRLVHVQPRAGGNMAYTGWEFCASDDETAYRANLERLQTYVNQQRAKPQC
ncbi:MAG: hypothetical protein JXO22_12530 [Phycisphaerae bacterium]|nr:hypothetical protein [Phycisphaerae bacterium]